MTVFLSVTIQNKIIRRSDSNLNFSQRRHLLRIKAKFQDEVDWKYKKGAREHDNTLLSMSVIELLTEMKQEAVDLYVYAETAIERELQKKSGAIKT